MPTINQLVRKSRKIVKSKQDPVLGGAPQRKGVCTKVYLASPKKPNSANRACGKFILSSGNSTKAKKRKTEVIAYIPYENARKDLKVHGVVLLQKKNKVDLPGIKYIVTRGAADVPGVISARQGRSLKGTTKPSSNN